MWEVSKTDESLSIFNRIVETCWSLKGFDIETVKGDTHCILFREGENSSAYGILEICQDWNDNLIGYPFKKVEEVMGQKTALISKVAILPEFRNRGNLYEILQYLWVYADTYKINRYVHLLDPLFFIALKREYKIPVYKCENGEFFYKGAEVYASFLDCDWMRKNYFLYPWNPINENKQKNINLEIS